MMQQAIEPNIAHAASTNTEVFLVATKLVLLRADGRMLVMLRGKEAPTNPLGWDLPGGILEYGEGAEECIVRETREETSIDIGSARVFHAIARANKLGEHWTTVFYVADAPSEEVKISWEHDEFKWISPEELEALPGSQRNKDAVIYFMQLRKEGKI